MQYLGTFSCSSSKYNAISQSRLKIGEVNIPSIWLLRMFFKDLMI